MPDDTIRRKFNVITRFSEPAPEFRDRLLHLIQLNSRDIIRAMAEKGDDMPETLQRRLYGPTGFIANMIGLRRDPADKRSYEDLEFNRSDILRAHRLLQGRQPQVGFSAFDLPDTTQTELDEEGLAFYQSCVARRSGTVIRPQFS